MKFKAKPVKALNRAASQTAGILPKAPGRGNSNLCLAFLYLPVASFSKGLHFSPLLLQVLLMNFFQQRSSWLEYIDPLLLLGWANWLLGNAALQCLSLEVWTLLLISSGFLRHGGDQVQEPTPTNTAKVVTTWNLLPQSSHWPVTAWAGRPSW